MGIGNKLTKPRLIDIYAIILRKGIIPNSATWPVILAILIGPSTKYLNTNQFLDELDDNLKKKLN